MASGPEPVQVNIGQAPPAGGENLNLGQVQAAAAENPNFLNLTGALGPQLEAQRMLRQNRFGIRLRICCESLLFLGCIHLGVFPDWWNGITDIGIAILLSTSLFHRASISTLVSVVLLAFLNFIVQFIAFLSLLKIELFDRKEAQHQFFFITYMMLIFCDMTVMLVTGNSSAMMLKDVLQIIMRSEENDGLENPLLSNDSLSPTSQRGLRGGPQDPQGPERAPPFSGTAYKLDVSDDSSATSSKERS